MATAVQTALKTLLSSKHLYQSIDIDLSSVSARGREINQEVTRGEPSASPLPIPLVEQTVEDLQKNPDSLANVPWALEGTNIKGAMRDVVLFQVPHINTYCSTCKDRPPHNGVVEHSCTYIITGNDLDQWYHLTYECQQCRGLPVVFLVRREKLKLRLAGRDPIEFVPPPAVLKGSPKFFSDAQIAHHAGQTLAGLFLLRVYIEQYWRSLPQVRQLIESTSRATGEEQGQAYQNALPNDFKSRFAIASGFVSQAQRGNAHR